MRLSVRDQQDVLKKLAFLQSVFVKIESAVKLKDSINFNDVYNQLLILQQDVLNIEKKVNE